MSKHCYVKLLTRTISVQNTSMCSRVFALVLCRLQAKGNLPLVSIKPLEPLANSKEQHCQQQRPSRLHRDFSWTYSINAARGQAGQVLDSSWGWMHAELRDAPSAILLCWQENCYASKGLGHAIVTWVFQEMQQSIELQEQKSRGTEGSWNRF